MYTRGSVAHNLWHSGDMRSQAQSTCTPPNWSLSWRWGEIINVSRKQIAGGSIPFSPTTEEKESMKFLHQLNPSRPSSSLLTTWRAPLACWIRWDALPFRRLNECLEFFLFQEQQHVCSSLSRSFSACFNHWSPTLMLNLLVSMNMPSQLKSYHKA